MKKFFSILCVLLLLFTLTVSAGADFDSFSGDSDYGGGSDWGSSSDWDSSDYGSSGSGSGSSSSISGVISFIIVVAIVVIVSVNSAKKKGKSGANRPGAARTDLSRLMPMESLLSADPGFNEIAFKEKLANLYVRLQNSWQNKDLEPIRPNLTDAFFAQSQRQLQALINAGRTNYVDRIAVLDVQLHGWYRTDAHDNIVASLKTRIVDFTVDDRTGKIVSGSNTVEKFMEYEWILTRSKGMTTASAEGTTSVHCPSCGAPVDINQSAKCPYCDSVLKLSDYDWAISQIKGISQQSR